MKNQHKATIYALIACFLWSTAFAGVKIGFKYMPSPFTFAGLRFTLAGLFLMPFTVSKNYFSLLKEHKKVIGVVVVLNVAVGYALYYTAMSLVGGATAAIIIGTGPLITAIMTHFFMENDRLNKEKLYAILFGFLGIVIIMINSKPTTSIGRKEILGMFLLLGNSGLTSFANIKVAQYKKGIEAKYLTTNQMFWGGLILVLVGRILEGPIVLNQPLEFYTSLIWLAIVSACAFSLWFAAIKLKDVKVSEVNMYKSLIPVLGASLSWIVLPDEKPTFISLLGMSFVLLSLVFYFKYKEKS